MPYFKAIIRVVKSIALKDPDNYMGFDTVDVLREPLIEANDKSEVKTFLADKYPQFFANGKIYERETKNDKAQFFYVVIFPLYQHEIDLIKEGEWKCDYCGHIHENRYVSRPITSNLFANKFFCGSDFRSGNDVINHSCFDLWKIHNYKLSNGDEMPDDLNYVKSFSPTFIYKITEKSTGKSYIGKTRNAPFFRWWNHLTHSGSPFGLYLRTTKLSEWVFEVLEVLPSNIADSDVFRIESEYMVKFNSINNGFNSVISSKNVNSTVQNQIDMFNNSNNDNELPEVKDGNQ